MSSRVVRQQLVNGSQELDGHEALRDMFAEAREPLDPEMKPPANC